MSQASARSASECCFPLGFFCLLFFAGGADRWPIPLVFLASAILLRGGRLGWGAKAPEHFGGGREKHRLPCCIRQGHPGRASRSDGDGIHAFSTGIEEFQT